MKLILDTDPQAAGLVPPGACALMEKVCRAAEETEGVQLPLYVQVRLTGNEQIRAVNREYRQTDRATDVLSFPSVTYPEGKTAAASARLIREEYDPEEDACFLGDIVISVPHAQAQAEQFGHSVQRELAYLLAHGLFHLFGYDHMTETDKRSMRHMEEKALDKAGLGRVTDDELIALAKEAMTHAYVPYSHFRVGACLLTRDGKVYQGCNIENGSYGATNCAERTALFKAVYDGERDFVKIAVAAEKSMPWPCGICRQALNEFSPDMTVLVACGDERAQAPLSALLPHGFGPNNGTLDFLGKDDGK